MTTQAITPETSICFGRGLDTMTRGEATALVERLGGMIAATPSEANIYVVGRTHPKKAPKAELIGERQFLEMVRLTEDALIGTCQRALENAQANCLRASSVHERAIIDGASRDELARAVEVLDGALAEMRAAGKRVAAAFESRWT